jgi:hypothetical protein
MSELAVGEENARAKAYTVMSIYVMVNNKNIRLDVRDIDTIA